MKMAVIRISWILLTAAVLAIGAVYGNAAYPALLAALVIAPAVMTVGNIAVRNKIDVNVQCPMNAAKGKTARVNIRIDNRSRFPVFIVGFTVFINNRLTGQTVKVHRVTSAMAKKSGEAYVDITGRFCGKLDITVSKVRLYDCFGIIGVRSKCTSGGGLVIQPDTFYQHVVVTSNAESQNDSEVYSQEKPGFDLTEPFQIREYVPGDSMRQIHWKLTGKFDRLIVKDPSLPVTRSVLIFWERRCESISPVRQDAQGEVCLSVCRAILDGSVQFTLGWNDAETGMTALREIRDMDDLVGVVPALMSAGPTVEGPFGGEAFCRMDTGERFSRVVYVTEKWSSAVEELSKTGRVTVLFCGTDAPAGEEESVKLFDPENYESRLLELEI